MKPFAAISSLLLLGTIGFVVTNLLSRDPEVNFTFCEEDIYAEL